MKYGVFKFSEDKLSYTADNAIKIYKNRTAAWKHADKLTKDQPHIHRGFVVREIVEFESVFESIFDSEITH